MLDEILKRHRLAIFLAHEQQRDIGAQQDRGRGHFEGLERRQRGEAVAERAVPDLIMILREDNELRGASPA